MKQLLEMIITVSKRTGDSCLTKRGSPGGSGGKESTYHAGDRFQPWVRKTPWRRKWQPTPVFLPGKFPGQGSLVGYSPCGHTGSDRTEQLHTYTMLNNDKHTKKTFSRERRQSVSEFSSVQFSRSVVSDPL